MDNEKVRSTTGVRHTLLRVLSRRVSSESRLGVRVSRELMWCSALTVLFVAPLLFSLVRHPRPMLLLFTLLLGATAFVAIQLLHRADQDARIHAYVIILNLLLSPRMMTAGPSPALRHSAFYYAFTFVLIAVLSLSGRHAWLVKIPVATVGLFSLVVGLVFFTHAATNAAHLDEELRNAIYQTDLHEAIGYVETFVGFTAVPLLFAFLFVPTLLLFRVSRSPVQTLRRGRFTVLVALALLLTWATSSASNEYLVVSSALNYHTAIQRYREALQQRAASADTRVAVEATLTRQAPETHVIVIGESTSRNHMGLYGYFRDTTPNLSRLAKSLVVLTDAISSDRFTQSVLAKSLTTADVDDHLGDRAAPAHSLIDLLRAAGLRVYWLSNQSRVGFTDTLVTVLSEGANRRVFLPASLKRDIATFRPDEALFPLVRTALDESAEATVIFVHLMGTHVPYKRRYPQHFARYRDAVPFGELGDSQIDPQLMARINEYDNAVFYNDYVVSTLIEELRGRGGVSSLLYFSDHGETPRGTTRAQRFSPGQVEIPMVFWFSDRFREVHSGLIDTLIANRRKRFMSDDLSAVALDLIGVDTRSHWPQRSLFRREFVERDRKTLSGKIDYDNYPDPIIMARNNMARLGVRLPRFTQKIYIWSGPNRSSLGQAVGLFPGIALDLVFNDEVDERGTFDIARSAPRMTLRDALEFLRSNQSEAPLLFRVGNLRASNAAKAIAVLLELEEAYRFRKRVVVVVPEPGEHLRSLAQAGFQITLMTANSGTVASSRIDSGPRGARYATMAVSTGPDPLARNPDASSNAPGRLPPIVVESDAHPSASDFVESMSTLGGEDATRAIAIVVPALSKFEEHF